MNEPFPLLSALLVDGQRALEDESEERQRQVEVLRVGGDDVEAPDGEEAVRGEQDANEDGARHRKASHDVTECDGPRRR